MSEYAYPSIGLLGKVPVSVLSDAVHTECIVVRSVSGRMADTQDAAAKSLHANGYPGW